MFLLYIYIYEALINHTHYSILLTQSSRPTRQTPVYAYLPSLPPPSDEQHHPTMAFRIFQQRGQLLDSRKFRVPSERQRHQHEEETNLEVGTRCRQAGCGDAASAHGLLRCGPG